MSELAFEKHTITTQTHGIPLVCTMKKYTRKLEESPKNGFILLLAHGAGFFKETWEPTIETLLSLDDASPVESPLIKEVWGVDCQNHGEACTVNEETLALNPGLLNIWDYADAFSVLYRSGLLGIRDPELDKVILCGHSAGAVGVTLATSFFNPPSQMPFQSIILVDPPIWSKDKDGQESDVYKMVEGMTPIRRDIWDSKEKADKWLKSRLPWAAWDDRVFNKYVEYGLRDLPTAYYPDRKTGVTLTTHRLAENGAFTGKRFSYDALYRLNQICDFTPVHIIFGGRNDMFERDVQDSLIDPKEGRTFATITRLEGVGHLVVQEAPDRLAKAILTILKGNRSTPQAKL